MKKIIVTGDRGYIGAVMVEVLLKKKYEVVGIDTEYFDDTFGKAPEVNYKKITKDIRSISKEELQGAFAIIHLAALSNDPLGEINKNLTLSINYEASVRLAKLARQIGVQRFLFFSSCSVFGGGDNKFLTEKDEVDPLTPYALSKVSAEKEILSLGEKEFIPIVLRNATVYGYSSRLRLDLVINDLAAQAVTSGEVVLSSNGKAWRPFIHVKDLATVSAALLKAPKKKVMQQIINVGATKDNYRMLDIAAFIKRVRPGIKITIKNENDADTRNYRVNFQKLHRLLPRFSFSVSILKGIHELMLQFEKNGLTKSDLTSDKYIRLKKIQTLKNENRLNQDLYWKNPQSQSEPAGIEGVIVKRLRKIPDERGVIFHMLRRDDNEFISFGEIYFSKSYPGVIKGWHIHRRMTLNYCVIEGMVKLVLYDDRPDSKTHKKLVELFIGEENYCLVRIPPGVANGYKTIGTKASLLVNCSTEPHDPTEMERVDPFSKKIPYDWKIIMR